MDERPFDIRSMPPLSTEHPASVYLNGPHEAAVSFLQSFFADTGGIALLTGEPGVGRNTVIVTALQALAQPASVVTLSDLSPPTLQALSHELRARRRKGHLTLLAVEDVEQLTAGALEGVGRLAALEDNEGPLLHVLLVGTPGRQCLLAEPPLSLLGARVYGHWHLRTLDHLETASYISHHLVRALAHEPTLLPPEVCAIVHAHTGGVPGLINAALQAILTLAADRRTRTITPRLANDALEPRRDTADSIANAMAAEAMAAEAPPRPLAPVDVLATDPEPEAQELPNDVRQDSDGPAETLATPQRSRQHTRRLGLIAIAAVILAAITVAVPRWRRTPPAPPAAAARASTAPVTPASARAEDATRTVGTAGGIAPPVTRPEESVATFANAPRIPAASDPRRIPTPEAVANAGRSPVSPTPRVQQRPSETTVSERIDGPALTPPAATTTTTTLSAALSPAEVIPAPEVPLPLEAPRPVGPTARIVRPSAPVPTAAPSAAVSAGAASSGAVIEPAAANTRAVDEYAVRTVLERYRVAFNTLDAGAAAAVWPSVDSKALGRAFDRLEEQEISFSSCQLDVTDSRATASCGGSSRYVPKVGNKNPRDEAREWMFGLEKTGDQWRIRSVTMR